MYGNQKQMMIEKNFDNIIKTLEKTYKSNKKITLSFKRRTDSHDLIIHFTLKKSTNFNVLTTSITFCITLDKSYPESVPYVTIITNV